MDDLKFIYIVTILMAFPAGMVFSANVIHGEKHNKFQTTADYVPCMTSEKNSAHPWCLPKNYNKEIPPWNFLELTNLTLPWFLFFDFLIFDIQEVNDRKQTVTLEMYSKIKWYEPRIFVNVTSPKWEEQVIYVDGEGHAPISSSQMKNFWFADLEIFGLKKYIHHRIHNRLSQAFKTNRNGLLRYIVRAEVVISCKMDFELYPFDSQSCFLQQGSFLHPKDKVECNASFSREKGKQRYLQYTIDVLDLPPEYHTSKNNGQVWAVCGFQMVFKRKILQIFCQVYLTSILLVALAWVSFVVDPLIVPGRMGLLVTVFLMLINIFMTVKSNAPKSSGFLNAIDIFLLVCVGYVFLAFLEYAIILFWCFKRKATMSRVGHDSSHCIEVRPRAAVRPITNSRPSAKEDWMRLNEYSSPMSMTSEFNVANNRLDYFFLILYPISFSGFAIFYFALYFN